MDVAGRKVLEALVKRRRCIPCSVVREDAAADEALNWDEVAIKEHVAKAVRGVVMTAQQKRRNPALEIAESACKLHESRWWQDLHNSLHVRREIRAFLAELRPILVRSMQIDFVDPHLDSDKPRYGDFAKVIRAIRRDCKIVLHFVTAGSVAQVNWEVFERLSVSAGRPVHVVARTKTAFTDEMVPSHDRYLLSDLACLSSTNGFDFDKKSMTLALLAPAQRDRVTQFFDKHYGLGVARNVFGGQ
jgi:hypothetical protein